MNQSVPVESRPAGTPAPLWRNVNFTLMWTSVAASGFGDRLIMLIGLALLGVKTNPDAKVTLSAAIYFWFHLPYLLLSPPGGWLADTFPRKWVMAICDEARAGILFYAFLIIPSAGVATALDVSLHWRVLGLIAAVGCFAAIFNPVRNATVPQLVPLQQLPAANGIIISIATIASLIGMLIGGWWISEDDSGTLKTCLLMAIVFYVVSGVMLLFLRIAWRVRKSNSQDRGFTRLFAGLTYMLQHRRTITLTAINMLVWGAAMIVSNVFIALSDKRYGFPADQSIQCMAEMTAALGAGMLAGGLGTAWMNTRKESLPIGLLGLFCAGFCVLALAFNEYYGLGLLFAFGTGFFGNVAIICTFTLLMGISPNYVRGRVMGVNGFATTVSIVAVNFIIWRLPRENADTIMVRALLPTGLVLMAIAVYGLYRTLRAGPMKEWNRNFFWHLDRIFMLVWHRVKWHNAHRVPMSGAVVLAANHTAGIDPFLVQAGLQRRVRWVMVKKNLYRMMNPLWRTIDPIVLEEGKAPIRQLKTMLEALEQGELTGIFPEGGLQRDHRNLQPFKAGIGMIAVRSGARIVPVWITGTPVVKKMIWHFLKPSRSHVYFGEPYQPDRTLSYEAVVEDLRRRMVELGRRANGDASDSQVEVVSPPAMP